MDRDLSTKTPSGPVFRRGPTPFTTDVQSGRPASARPISPCGWRRQSLRPLRSLRDETIAAMGGSRRLDGGSRRSGDALGVSVASQTSSDGESAPRHPRTSSPITAEASTLSYALRERPRSDPREHAHQTERGLYDAGLPRVPAPPDQEMARGAS